MHNPNSQATQHYSIVEDLSQSLCAMSTLEVLQSFPMQCKALLSTIGGIDPAKSNVISFDTNCNESFLLPVKLVVKTVSVEVEVIGATLEYNFLLGHT
jgi:hypothetical protein